MTESEGSWPAWKIALLVGVPVVVGGVGYYYYTKKADRSQAFPDIPESTSRKDPEGSSCPVKQVDDVEEDPFKIASNYKNEGNTCFKAGEYQEAIENYTRAINVCPSSKKQELSTFHQNKAAAYEKLETWEQVIEECTKAIDLNPKYIKALSRRARALETLGRKSECLEDMTAVCIMEQFQNPASMVFADRVLKEMGKAMASERYETREPVTPSVLFVRQYFASFTEDIVSHPLTDEQKKDTDSYYIQARIALEEGDLLSAISSCTAEIGQLSGDKPGEGQVEEGTKIAAPTGDDESQARTPGKRCDDALLLRGTLYLLMGDTANAKSDLENIINKKNADVKLRANALIKRGSLNMQEQKSEEAEVDFNRAVEIDPENTDVLHHRGQLKILLDKTEEALTDFEKCMKLKPDFALAHAQYCYSIYRQSFAKRDVVVTRQATAKFEELIKKFPNCSECYGLYAQALTDQGDFHRADEMFVKAIEVEPDNATQYVHRGLLCLQWKQNMEESIQMINKGLEIDKKCDFAHETMGTIEVQRGNLDKACEHFEMAISLAKSELEMAHLFSLKAAAVAQGNLARKYGIKTPSLVT